MNTLGKGGRLQKPRRDASGETSLADTLTLHSQPPELREHSFLLFKAPSLWHFVTAT